jgi:4-carboxymuconolactone decarboxylase
MHDDDRRAAGEAARRRILGDAHVDRAQARTTDLTSDFQDFLTRCAWAEVWTRPGLDERARRVLVTGTLVALGRWEEFRLHARAALATGALSVDELREILLQQALYCGVPAANQAFAELAAVLDAGA